MTLALVSHSTFRTIPHKTSLRQGPRPLLAIVTLVASSLGVTLLSANNAFAGTNWTPATEVPGTAALNVGGDALMFQASCAGVGSCGSVGTYTDAAGNTQAFVANEVNGTWGNAIEIPGWQVLNTGGKAGSTFTISCAAAGSCSAGGSYTDGSNQLQAFVVDETNGTWGNAIEVPGTAALNVGNKVGEVASISCSSAGNCSAGGTYANSSQAQEAFVVDETNGTWGNAIEVPGTATLNGGGAASVVSLSCSTSGNCSGEGLYADTANHLQTFVANETNGTWGNAIEVPGLSILNVGALAGANEVSCSSAGNCGLAGFYDDSSSHLQAFVANETNGTWGSAIEVPGTASLNVGALGSAAAISCPANGACSAGGAYTDSSGNTQAYVVDESNGTWGSAIEIPGTASLNAGGLAAVASLSCASPNNCSVGGLVSATATTSQAFVATEINGAWSSAVEVPGVASLNVGGTAIVFSVSCISDGSCAVAGQYTDSSNNFQTFVASLSASAPVTKKSPPGAPTIRVTSPTKGDVSIALVGVTASHGQPISHFQYSLNNGPWINGSEKASKTFLLAHLTSGKIYHVRLRALNKSGPGAPSRAVTLKVK